MPEGYGNTKSEHGDVGAGNGQNAAGNKGGGAGGVAGGGGALGGPKKDKSLLDKLADLFGGKAAYNNNPNAPKNQKMTGTVPSFPDASWGYVAGKFFDTAFSMTPGGWANAAFAGVNGVTTGEFDGMFTEAAKQMGATKGEQGPDVAGGGFERGGQGGALTNATPPKPVSSAATAKPSDTLAPDWADGRNPTATQLLLDKIISQSLNPSQYLLGA